MQVSNIYAAYDRKAQYHLPPFTAYTDTDAVRSFASAVTTSDTPLSQYPADFDLVCIGIIDLETGLIDAIHPHKLIINGLVCLQNASVERNRYRAILDPQPPVDPAQEGSDDRS